MNLISILVSSANATAPQGLEHIPHTHLLINGAAGWSISANQLLDQAAALGGDAIFCDDDVTFLPESLDGVRAHYQQADAFGFDLHDLSGARQCGARHTFPDGVLTDWIHPGPAYVGHVSTSAIYLTEKAIQSGVRFPVWPGVHWEDVGYTLGLWLAGCRVLAVPGRVNHNIVGGIGATKRHTPEYLREVAHLRPRTNLIGAVARIRNALAAGDFMGRTMGEGAMPQIALSYPNKFGPDQAKLLRDNFVATYTGTGARKLPLVLEGGMDVKVLSIKPVDMELLAQRGFEKDDICEAIGVPGVLIGRNEKTTSWGTGVEQITLGFVRYRLKPLLCRWEEELNRKLFRRAGTFVEFNLDALMRGDSKAQAEYFRAAIGGPGTGDGWMSVDQVRTLQNMPPLGGEWDKPFRATRATTTPAPTPPAA